MNALGMPYPLATVARILRVTRPVILRLIRHEGLPAQRTPQGLRVDSLDLDGWVSRRMQSAASEAAGLANTGGKP